jgi:hypothetical protein
MTLEAGPMSNDDHNGQYLDPKQCENITLRLFSPFSQHYTSKFVIHHPIHSSIQSCSTTANLGRPAKSQYSRTNSIMTI